MSVLQAIYLVVLLVSILLLVGSIVLGIGHDADVDHDHDASHGDVADGPSWLSSKVVLAGASGFGAFGLGAYAAGLLGLVTVPIALVGFFAMAAGVREFVLKPMLRQQSNSLLSRQSYVGMSGKVTLDIRPGNTGLVRFLDRNGTQVTEQAVTSDGSAMPAETQVIVVDIAPQYVVVDPNPFEKGN